MVVYDPDIHSLPGGLADLPDVVSALLVNLNNHRNLGSKKYQCVPFVQVLWGTGWVGSLVGASCVRSQGGFMEHREKLE